MKDEKVIKFKIDKGHFEIKESQNPVAGEYLRGLAPVPEDYDLWLRSRGNEDDNLIEAGSSIEVKNGDHFYTSRKVINPGGETK